MLTIESEVFRGIKLNGGMVAFLDSNSHDYRITIAFKNLAEEVDRTRNSSELQFMHHHTSEVILAYWKHKIALARKHARKDSQSTNQPFGPDRLVLVESPFEGPQDGRSLQVTTETPEEKNNFQIREILKNGKHVYDYYNPPILKAHIITPRENEFDFEVMFNKNQYDANSPFLIERFKRTAYYLSVEKGFPKVQDERVLTFNLDRIPTPAET